MWSSTRFLLRLSSEKLWAAFGLLIRFGSTVAHWLAFRPTSFVESSLVSCKKIRDRILPGKLLLNPSASKLTHLFSLIRIVEQPNDLGGKIGHLILRVCV